MAKEEVSRIALELEEIKRSRLSPEHYRKALKQFREVYGVLDPLQQSDLLAYLRGISPATDIAGTPGEEGSPVGRAFSSYRGPPSGHEVAGGH